MRLVAALLLGGCINPVGDLELEGAVGAPCPVCSEACDTSLSFEFNCDCDTCLWLGFDPEERVLLHCITGTWERRRSCPGGVSVACTDGDAYAVHCLDADGTELPLSE